MRELCGELDLAEKSIAAERRGEIGMQGFERYVSTMSEVVCQVDGRHAAGPELSFDAIATGERGRERIIPERATRHVFRHPAKVARLALLRNIQKRSYRISRSDHTAHGNAKQIS